MDKRLVANEGSSRGLTASERAAIAATFSILEAERLIDRSANITTERLNNICQALGYMKSQGVPQRFEAHITCPREQSKEVAGHAELLQMSFSAIDGDPVMGKQAHCYLTAYDTNSERLRAKVYEAGRVLQESGVTVLREKIEEILYDSKTKFDAWSVNL